MTIEDIIQILKKNYWDMYIITHNNMFIGQDVLPQENKLLELCNFSGSAGNLIISNDKCYLLVDGRYTLQAQKEVSHPLVEVICTTDSIGTWIQKNISTPSKIAYSGWCHSIAEVDFWQRTLKQHQFIEDEKNTLLPMVSTNDDNIFEHGIEFAGISAEEKISYLTTFMQDNKLDAFFVSEPDAVSWLLNLRSDILTNTPILRAFVLVNKDAEVSIFTNDFNKISDELASYKGKTIGLAFNHTPKSIYSLMKNHKIWVQNHPNPIQKWKAIKNPIELDGFKDCHLKDGIAVCKFLYWLEHNWQGQSELSISQKLYELRAQAQLFKGNSFDTIAAFAGNGAIVHYHPTLESNQNLFAGNILLLDSGGQYLNGTTDITRTVAIGNISNVEITNSFTQVLKAHIAAANAVFPPETAGNVIDCISRAQLWQFGKDYQHGTGHGVGYYSNVHEGPFSLSKGRNSNPLEASQVTSIEPGYYVENQYGIRIENLYYIAHMNNPEFPTPMLCFVPLTLVPIDKHLINKYLLSKQEICWLNQYHRLVFEKLNQYLPAEMQSWFAEACSPL